MVWFYIATAVFGGGFVLPALLGALDTDADIDFDTDGATDLEGAPVDSAIGGIAEWVGSLLNFKTVVLFATFFGAVGIVLTVLDYSEPVPALTAGAMGVMAAVANARVMAYLRRSDVSSLLTEQHLKGTNARVVVPIGQKRRGKVKIDVGGQPTYMVALPFRSDLGELAQGDQVVVVEVKEGTAYVIPFPG